MVENNHWYTVYGWMINELDLKGTDLIVYATIYSFTHGAKFQTFNGSAQYLADWANSTMRSAQNAIKSLKDKGLLKITKIDATHNAYNVVVPDNCKIPNSKKTYEKNSQGITKNFHKTYEKNSQDITKNFHKTYEKFSHNINNNNKNIYKTDRQLMSGCLSERKKYIPTLDEVVAYAQEQHLKIDPVKFFEKNQERGWITKKGEPIKRWKSIMWSWSDNEEIKKPAADKNSFQQNTYDFDQLEKDLVKN